MLVKLHNTDNSAIYINTDYIVEIIPYKAPEPSAQTCIVFNAAGHAGLSVDVKENIKDVVKLCTPVSDTVSSKLSDAGTTVSNKIKSIFRHD